MIHLNINIHSLYFSIFITFIIVMHYQRSFMVINFTEATYRPSVFFFLHLKLYRSFTSFRNPCLLRIPIYISVFFVSELRRFPLHTFPCVHFFDVFILFQFNAVLCSTLYSAPSNQHRSPNTIFYLSILQIFFIFK